MREIFRRFVLAVRQLVKKVSLPKAVPLGAATLLAVAIFKHLSIQLFLLVHLSAVSIAFVLLLPEILAKLMDRPEFAGQIFARRTTVLATLLSTTLTIAFVLVIFYRPWQHEGFTLEAAVITFVQGAFVGGFIRALFVTYLDNTLKGASTEAIEAMLLLAVAVYLLLFPASEQRYILAPSYLAGISAGFLAHFGFRSLTQQIARSVRIRRYILAQLYKPGRKFEARESHAINLFAREQFQELEKLFKKNALQMTTALVLVQAAMYRLQEKYDKALTVIDAELIRCNSIGELMPYLHLQKALCLAELGINVKGMFEELRLVFVVNPGCVLAKSTWALRTAERIPPENSSATDRALLKRALIYARQALWLAQVEDPSLWGGILGLPVPVTWSYLLDIVGYVSLRNGDKTLSKALLEQCLTTDPKFAPPYLHLGEWYLIMSFDRDMDQEARIRNMKLARLSLNIAKALEGDRNSLTKRRAQSLLNDYFGNTQTRLRTT